MDAKIYNEIIKEYENKRNKALDEAKKFKESVFEKSPELSKFEKEIASLTISSMKKNLTASKVEREIENQNLEIKVKEIQEKINEKIEKLGYKKEDFEPKFECEKCKDTGYNGKNKCSCLKQKILNRVYSQFYMENFDEECFHTFDFGYFSDKVNEEKYGSKKSPRENILEIKAISEKFCSSIENKKEKNLLFIGDTGLGKTFLSNCIAGEVIKGGYTAIYQTAPMLMDMITEYKTSFDKDSKVKEKYNQLFEVDLLIIDDLGTETNTDFKFMELLNIINTRIIKGKKIVISTNLSLQKLYNLYDARLTSRLIGNFNICKFFGEDVRIIKKRISV
ncbi:MAG: ATP-binding protein [Clostridia bacterium]|nr:ATP-binding protein [Clostridia bacterium]